MASSYEEEGYCTTVGVVDGVAWFEDGTSVNNVTVELIRAAPDLLAALENLLPYLEERSQSGERWAALCAREAISKAKGGE